MHKICFIMLFVFLLSACGVTGPVESITEEPDVANIPTAMNTETQATEQPAIEPTSIVEEVPTDVPVTEMITTEESNVDEAPEEVTEEELPPNAQVIPLRYLADLSNFGPQDATGTLTLLPDTNSIIVEVVGLPPVEGKVYEVWMLPAADPGGRFNTNANGTGRLEQPLENDLSNYNQMILTVEPEPDDSPAPAPEHSIGSDPF